MSTSTEAWRIFHYRLLLQSFRMLSKPFLCCLGSKFFVFFFVFYCILHLMRNLYHAAYSLLVLGLFQHSANNEKQLFWVNEYNKVIKITYLEYTMFICKEVEGSFFNYTFIQNTFRPR